MMEADRVRIRPRISMSGCERSMQNSFKADASDNQVASASAATSSCKKGRPLMPLVGKSLCLALLLGAVCALQGCETDNRPAPTPTPNPHPQKTLKLLITVEPSLVDRVEVSTQWVVTNLGCAPVQPISGAARVKQVDVKEHVEKMGDNYMATIIVDRFLPDSCHWSGGGAGIRFFHGNYWLA